MAAAHGAGKIPMSARGPGSFPQPGTDHNVLRFEAPAKTRFSLARAAQCVPINTKTKTYDPVCGTPKLMEASGLSQLPCGHA